MEASAIVSEVLKEQKAQQSLRLEGAENSWTVQERLGTCLLEEDAKIQVKLHYRVLVEANL